jgi:hypothetical protein
MNRVLLVKDRYVVRTQNHTDTGSFIPIACSLLMDSDPIIEHCYIAGSKLFEPLAELNALMQDSVPGWRMRIANRRRNASTYDGRTRIVGRFFVDYFCIDERVKHKRIPRRRFDVMNLDLLYEKPSDDPDEQMAMTLAILDMCENRGVAIRGTKGAIGSAMLKKSPKWEKGRHSAPRFINKKSREFLPGNFYSVSFKIRKTRDSVFSIPHCYYIDQTSSHHTIAASCPIPHPHYIRARGHYKAALRNQPKRWTDLDTDLGRKLTSEHHGLLLCKATISQLPPTTIHLYPQWARKRGTQFVWIWTPEFRLFAKDHRIQIESIYCAYTGHVLDPVLPEYAKWAISHIAANKETAKYRKGALLSAYGMLAFNGDKRSIYRYWGGESSRPQVEIPIAGMVGESVIKVPNDVELSTVNVIARGLIESETRTRSIEYARELHGQGFHVPQIYADGLLVETDALPFIPENWRVSHSLTNVHIPRPNAIVSDQMVKLPGVAGNEQDREWERRREAAMAPIRAEQSMAMAR